MESIKPGWVKIHIGIEPVFVNMQHVIRIHPHGHGSLIACSDGKKLESEEGPEKIFAQLATSSAP